MAKKPTSADGSVVADSDRNGDSPLVLDAAPAASRTSLLQVAPVAGTAAARDGATVTLPGLPGAAKRLRLPHVRMRYPRVLTGAIAGRVAFGTLLLGCLLEVLFAANGPSVLVNRSAYSFPNWEAGPLHGLIGRPFVNPLAYSFGLSGLIVAMLLAYAVVLLAVRSLSLRAIVVFIVAAHVILLLGPPTQLTDLFNYLGYARLGGLHHLNPYTHVMLNESHDPVFRFTSWHNLSSPYGPLFTVLSYPLALMPLPVAYWVIKVVTVLLSLTFVWLIYRCARLLGRDPRFALVFVAANPIFLIYAVGGFHNDFFMLVPSMAAITLLLARRDRSAGAMVMVAVAVKFSAALLLPFILIAARPAQRRKQVVIGAAIAAVPLLAMQLFFFRLALPNLSQQSTLLTDFSVPNVVGDLAQLGGGTPGLLRLADVALVATVLYLLWRRRELLSSAGWATFALIVSLAWLVPWYVVWLLPLAALSTSIRLRRASLVLTVFLVLTFLPITGYLCSLHDINPMGGAAGQASSALQQKLAGS